MDVDEELKLKGIQDGFIDFGFIFVPRFCFLPVHLWDRHSDVLMMLIEGPSGPLSLEFPASPHSIVISLPETGKAKSRLHGNIDTGNRL